MAASYNNTWWFYERLSGMVFGQAQVNAQNYFLDYIKPGWRILIIGGGTGAVIEHITQLHPDGLKITYVESSEKMMMLSKKKNSGQNEVNFITDDIASVTHGERLFDAVLTAFVFDNFSDERLARVFPLIDAQLAPGGVWLETDFQLTGPLWQKLLLKSMYVFFGLMGAVEVARLPQTNKVFARHGYSTIASKTFYGKFIASKVYRK